MDEDSKNLAKIEVFLFQHGKPAETKKISNVLGLKKEKCLELIEKYRENLEKDEKRGLVIIEKDNKIQLTTKPELGAIIEKITKEEFTEEPSPASLETLAIIAYLEPVKKTTIDFIRGVNSSYILRNLTLRGLVEKEKTGHTYSYHKEGEANSHEVSVRRTNAGTSSAYQVTFNFLKHLGVKSTKELPEFEKYKDLLEKYNTEVNI
ncbi:MAG: SMC-Scp complex subunit ScpB [Desulfosalsimonadaceae bacterium]